MTAAFKLIHLAENTSSIHSLFFLQISTHILWHHGRELCIYIQLCSQFVIVYELLATGSTTTSWPDHLFTCVQINTAGHSFTATSPQHTRTTAARLFVQSPCCLFRRLLTFYFFAVCTFERRDRRRKREAGWRPPVRGDWDSCTSSSSHQ